MAADRTSTLAILAGLLLAVATGCGGKSTVPTASGGSKSVDGVTKAASNQAASDSQSAGSKHVRTDADGRKWVGDIPYDVFFDDPLAVVSNSASVPTMTPDGAASPATSPAPTTPAAAPTATTTAAGGAANWKNLVSIDQLVDETKRVRNHLTSSLQSQGTYNGNYKELQVDGAVMAAIAGIIAQHPDDVSWKTNARFVKAYGHKLYDSAKALGREPYEQSQTAAEGIVAVLSGNLPADAGDPADVPFAEAAHRAGVMKRIEKASEWMRANINSESVFKKEKDQILSESTILSVLAKVVADKSYESADEDDYQNFAKTLFEGGREAISAAEDQAYPKFQEAINKITKSCADCHANYGNG
jgi:cytochrome c556